MLDNEPRKTEIIVKLRFIKEILSTISSFLLIIFCLCGITVYIITLTKELTVKNYIDIAYITYSGEFVEQNKN